MKTITLRTANEKDIDTIAQIHAESWRVAYRGMLRDQFLDRDVYEDRRSVWTERLTSPPPEQCVWLAEQGMDVLGFVCILGNRDPILGTFVDNLHVVLPMQRHGIGRRLMRHVAHWTLREFPDTGLYLEVLEGNTRARRFYEALGAQHHASNLWTPPGGGELTSLTYAWLRANHLLASTGVN